MKNIILCVISVIGLSSCANTTTWIAYPSPAGKCAELATALNKSKENEDDFIMTAKNTCAQAGKTYAGEYQCNEADTTFKFKCK